MNYVHLYKHVCSSSALNKFSHQTVIRPFIKNTICKRSFSRIPEYEEEEEEYVEEEEVNKFNHEKFFGWTSKNSAEESRSFSSSADRVPPDVTDQIETDLFFKQLDALLETMEGESGGLRIPYTVDVRDKLAVNQVIDIGRHCRVTAAGRLFSYSALVIMGTGNGTAGLGYGKAEDPMTAVAKAQNDAQKRMITIARWHGALPHPVVSRYRGTKVVMMAGKPGTGITGHPMLQLVAEAFGLDDITCKTFRSRNTRKIVAAMVWAILKNANLHPASKAKMLGRKFISWEDNWKPPTPPPKERVRKTWSTTAAPTDQERHENLKTIATAPGIDLYAFAREYGIDLSYEEVLFRNLEPAPYIATDAEVTPPERTENQDEEHEQEEEEALETVSIEEDESVLPEEDEQTEDQLPDLPPVFPQKPLNTKGLTERILRETKVAPLAPEPKQKQQ